MLALVAPALLAAEVGLLAVALRGGWLRDTLRADRWVLRRLPRILARRRRVQRLNRTSAQVFAEGLTAQPDSRFWTRSAAFGPSPAC